MNSDWLRSAIWPTLFPFGVCRPDADPSAASMRLKFGINEPNASSKAPTRPQLRELGNESAKMAHGAEPTPGRSGFDTQSC